MYTLIILNLNGRDETTQHETKTAVRRHVRSYDIPFLRARVYKNGELIWNGSALSFK